MVPPPPTAPGLTMTAAVMVLKAFTTFVRGKARCSCSASESVLETKSVGGKPPGDQGVRDVDQYLAGQRLVSNGLQGLEGRGPLVALTKSSAPAPTSP